MTWTLRVTLATCGLTPEAGAVVAVAPASRYPTTTGSTVLVSAAKGVTDTAGELDLTVASVPGMAWKVAINGQEYTDIPNPGDDAVVVLADQVPAGAPVTATEAAQLRLRLAQIEQAGGLPINLTETEPGIWQIGALT